MGADVVVLGAGPAGAAAAAWAARAGLDTLLVDAATFPRDKTCGDGLTPRAVAELQHLGMGSWLRGRAPNWGLRAHGFGRTWHLPWPGGNLPGHGAASPRMELDNAVVDVALASGARSAFGHRARGVARDSHGHVRALRVRTPAGPAEIACRWLIVADGARSQIGRDLGRQWHRDTVYGVAARSYIDSGRADDPWISSHLELRDDTGEVLSGYGWIFPLGSGQVNIGVGTLATAAHPADINLRSLLQLYVADQRGLFDLTGRPRAIRSALLPMGGAVSGVAGPNWMLIGDAAGCVNPLNGEGIDYGLETGRLAAAVLARRSASDSGPGLQEEWPARLREHYGPAFSIARRAAGLLTVPGLLPTLGPVGMRSRSLMKVALRVMGNLMTEEDNDIVARAWDGAGRLSAMRDPRPPFA